MAELRVKGTGTLKLFENDNTSSVTIASPASLSADKTITLPDADVTLASGTMLATDGDGSGLSGVGKIGQVVQAVKTDTFTSAATSYTDLTGITVDITPSATSSKVLVLCSLTLAASVGGGPELKLLRDSTDLGLGDTDGNRARVTTAFSISATSRIVSVPMIYLDSPSSTSALTYKVQGFGWNTNTIYVNRTEDDADEAYRQRGSSSITVMEVLA
jgi:hypothetical protein